MSEPEREEAAGKIGGSTADLQGLEQAYETQRAEEVYCEVHSKVRSAEFQAEQFVLCPE